MQTGVREGIVHRLARRGEDVGLEEGRVRFEVLFPAFGETALGSICEAEFCQLISTGGKGWEIWGDEQGEVVQHAEVLRLVGEVSVDVRGGVIGGHVNGRFVYVGHFDGRRY